MTVLWHILTDKKKTKIEVLILLQKYFHLKYIFSLNFQNMHLITRLTYKWLVVPFYIAHGWMIEDRIHSQSENGKKKKGWWCSHKSCRRVRTRNPGSNTSGQTGTLRVSSTTHTPNLATLPLVKTPHALFPSPLWSTPLTMVNCLTFPLSPHFLLG